MARVAIERCGAYVGDEVRNAVDTAVGRLGGWEAFVRPGMRVLVKPNLLTDRLPEENVTTHPEVLRAVVRGVRAAGGEAVVGDSPCCAAQVERVWERTGMRAVCAEEGVGLAGFEGEGNARVEVGGHVVTVARVAMEADLVVNVPKVKTHTLTVLTAAVKNLYGLIPGYQKAVLHKRYVNAGRMGWFLARLYAHVRPGLTVADAIEGMEGDGPSAGATRRLGFVAASDDGVALDATVCRVLGIPVGHVVYLREAEALGAGETREERIEVMGATVADVRAEGFRAPGTLGGRLIPGWLGSALGGWIWIRPRVTDACVGCGRCVRVCPVEALRMEGKRPALAGARCIGCCCCHEACPARAIEMTQSPLLNLLRRGRLPGE